MLRGTWDLPGLEIKLMSPALADGFFTTEPTGKPQGEGIYGYKLETASKQAIKI